MFKTIDKGAAKQIAEGARENLAEYCEEFGLTIAGGATKYDPTAGEVIVTLRFTVAGALGRDAADFVTYCGLFGLKAEDLNRTFHVRGTEYRIVGLRPSARKMPVLAERVDNGQRYAFAAEGVRVALVTTCSRTI